MSKNKHLSYNNRIDIEKYLGNGFNFTEISRLLNKSISTISCEVKNRRTRIQKKNPYSNSSNYICDKLVKAPYVCNNCDSKTSCRKTRYEYFSKEANSNYRKTLINSRIGIDMNPDEFDLLNKIIKEDIYKGHSFSMIINNHKDVIHCTKKTLYNYLHKEYLDIHNIDLPRIVRYKKRSKDVEKKIRNTKQRINRTYKDFLLYKEAFFIKNNYDASIVQMDTVEGIKGDNESVLLTLLFVQSNFLLAFKMASKSIECVSQIFDFLKDILGEEFYTLFQIILTDNGSEFYDPDYIEKDNYGVIKTKVFYCDPRASQQKGSIEVTHEYIRRYIPKSISFNPYSQDQINTMLNHINSVPRDKFNGKNAFKIQQIFSSLNFFTSLGYKEVDPLDIILKPYLISQKKGTTKISTQ